MRAWRKYKKWKGQRNVLVFPCMTDYFEATDKTRPYIFRRFAALLKAYRVSGKKDQVIYWRGR